MELLDLIFNVKTLQTTCLFCFNKSENTTNVDELIEIHNEDSTILVTIRNVTKYLFSFYEILFYQACNSCTNLILSIYKLLKRGLSKMDAIQKLVNRIDKQILITTHPQTSKIYVKIKEQADTKILNKNKADVENEIDSYLDDKYSIKCNLCTAKFKSKEELKFHKKVSHITCNKSLVCVICGKIFKKPSSLKSHLNSHMEIECPYCFKILKNNSHYHIHLKNHNKTIKRITKTRYKCNDCDHESSNKVDLASHMYRKHLNKRPFICDICQKQFYSQRNLNEHILIHLSGKINTCEICGDHFSGKQALNNHLKLHSGYRPYKCEVCTHTFVTVSRKNEHVKRKHGEKRFSCELCERKYCLRALLLAC